MPRRVAALDSVRFDIFLDAAPDAMIVVGHEGRILTTNTHARTLFGYSAEELAGRRIEDLVPERFRGAHIGHREHYVRDPQPRPMGVGLDLQGLRKDGTEFPVEISLSPLQTADGVVVIAAIRDATERRRIERALQEKNAELERVNGVKDHFLASLSHELRTPLNAIIGFTGTLLMKLPGPLTDEQDEQLTTVQTSARHLLAIINDLLDLAKIESGNIDLTVEAVWCRSVLTEVSSALLPFAAAKELTFTITLPPRDLVVQANRRALSQILINLANNAIKFTPSGQVTISAARVPDGAATAISVADTGIGIRPEDRARLFQTFVQLETTAPHRHEGTGLGLYLSQRLAALLGGYITCESEPGKGSTFTLVLPDPR